jgi:predicted Zn-dependent peptidase
MIARSLRVQLRIRICRRAPERHVATILGEENRVPSAPLHFGRPVQLPYRKIRVAVKADQDTRRRSWIPHHESHELLSIRGLVMNSTGFDRNPVESRRLEENSLLGPPEQKQEAEQQPKNYEHSDYGSTEGVPVGLHGGQFTSMRIPIETYHLENGLFVTLSEDHTAPIVAVNLWYHVGSANEKPGRTGFAHLFEHMLFQGSAHVGSNEHFELIQRAGGTLNGSTWLERTNYFETVPSNELALALWLEADRMGELLPAMTQEKLDTQRDVVKNERRWAVDNQPYGTMLEKMQELVFPSSHPFQHSLIGSMEDLTAASLDDVAQFFSTYYTPDNAVLSIAGDFEQTEARRLVSEYFGPIPSGKGRPPLPPMNLPGVFGKQLREVVHDNVSLPRLFMAFRSPVFGSEKYYAASVLSAVLGLRKGSRLHRSLVRDRQIAADVSAFTFDLAKGTDLLVVDVTARPEIGFAQLEEEVEREIDLLYREGVTELEVKRAVALIETDLVASLQSAGERADRISMFATYFKRPELINEQADRYREVTAGQVNSLVAERFGQDNRASLLYIPKEGVESEDALALAAGTG